MNSSEAQARLEELQESLATTDFRNAVNEAVEDSLHAVGLARRREGDTVAVYLLGETDDDLIIIEDRASMSRPLEMKFREKGQPAETIHLDHFGYMWQTPPGLDAAQRLDRVNHKVPELYVRLQRRLANATEVMVALNNSRMYYRSDHRFRKIGRYARSLFASRRWS